MPAIEIGDATEIPVNNIETFRGTRHPTPFH